MTVANDKELGKVLRDAYSSNNFAEIKGIISQLEMEHPYSVLYKAVLYAPTMNTLEDISQNSAFGRLASDFAWKKYGATNNFEDFFESLMDLFNAYQAIEIELSNAIADRADRACDFNDSVLREVRKIQQTRNLNQREKNNYQRMIDENKAKYEAFYAETNKLISALNDDRFAIIDHYLDICEENHYFSSCSVEYLSIYLEAVSEWDDIAPDKKTTIKRYTAAKEKMLGIKKYIDSEKYWSEHPGLKEELMEALEKAKKEEERIAETVHSKERELQALRNQRAEKTPFEIKVDKIGEEIYSKEKQINSLGLFKGKMKKTLREEITSLNNEMVLAKEKAVAERSMKNAELDGVIQENENHVRDLQDSLNKARENVNSIQEQLNR